MQQHELKELRRRANAPRRLTAAMFGNVSQRTLVYGCTRNRDTLHAYVGADAKIHLVEYDSDGFLLKHATEDELTAEDYEPSRLAYPEACDFAFCDKLLELGVDLNFLNHEERALPESGFYGKVLEELTVVPESHVPARIRITAGEISLPAGSSFSSNAERRSRLTKEMHNYVNAKLDRLSRLYRYCDSEVRAQVDALPGMLEGWLRSTHVELQSFVLPESAKKRLLKEMDQQVFG